MYALIGYKFEILSNASRRGVSHWWLFVSYPPKNLSLNSSQNFPRAKLRSARCADNKVAARRLKLQRRLYHKASMQGRTKDGGTFVKGLQTRSDKTTRNAQSLMFTLYCKTSISVHLYPKSKCPPSKIAFLGFVSWHIYFSSLSEPFTHQAIGRVRWCRTRHVIPVTVCSDWH